MTLIPTFIGALAFTIIQAIVFLFVVIATPLPQYGCGKYGTITFWGRKECGAGTRYYEHTGSIKCRFLRNNMGAGAAFAIISVIVTLASLVLGILMLVHCMWPILIPLGTSCGGVLSILICWTCVADMRNTRHCINTYYAMLNYPYDTYHYGPGFGLMLTAWFLQLINAVLIALIAFF